MGQDTRFWVEQDERDRQQNDRTLLASEKARRVEAERERDEARARVSSLLAIATAVANAEPYAALSSMKVNSGGVGVHQIRNAAMHALGPCPAESGECAIRRACTNKCGRIK